MLSIRSFFKKKDNSVRVIRLQETDSTNNYLRQLAATDRSALGERLTVAVADYQTAGRGQGTNTWESEPGKNLLFSILCHPVYVPIPAQFTISEAIALAIRDSLDKVLNAQPSATNRTPISIKWPNDIYVDDCKICGILIENNLGGGHIRDCIIGIGIDVNQEAFHSDAPNPVSLRQILGHEVDREALLQDVIRRFTDNLADLENGNYGMIAGRYMSALYRAHGFYPYRDADGDFEAAIVEVEDDGHLILRDRDDRIRSYAFKEVAFSLSPNPSPSPSASLAEGSDVAAHTKA